MAVVRALLSRSRCASLSVVVCSRHAWACWPKVAMPAPSSRSWCSVWRTSLTKTLPWPRQLRPKLRMTLLRFCFRSCTWVCRAVRRRLHDSVMWTIRSSVFLSFIQRGGIGDALRALFTWKGVNDKMSRTDQTVIHGGSGLDSHEFVHEALVNAVTKLAKGGGQHKVGLRGVDSILSQASSIHDGEVRAKPTTDIFI